MGIESGLLGLGLARVGELAVGTSYVANTLEQYLRAGAGVPSAEPLTLSLTRFACVTLVESSPAVALAPPAHGPSALARFPPALHPRHSPGGGGGAAGWRGELGCSGQVG
mgnify:CR=1 FL=1